MDITAGNSGTMMVDGKHTRGQRGLGASQDHDHCKLQSCTKINSPVIKIPFWLKGRQPDDCGYPIPGFELSCTVANETVLELPYAGKFFVRSIDYKSQELEVYDPADN
ncbi:hypothetical protein HHK36_027530 [Tetracentron sinense]|uniref:RING-type E3 ubiquitin transferase n=1 Tax=Tetracentron sinense TaxID=13715 RepID=A0A834YGV9_TETSI|nr:hypothetical protein HHK36_027530 [Tetracentron sinense]